MSDKIKVGSWVYVKNEYFSNLDGRYTIPSALIFGTVEAMYDNKQMLVIKRFDSTLEYASRYWNIHTVSCEKLPNNRIERNQKLFLLKLEI
jgi:hypothetical protein